MKFSWERVVRDKAEDPSGGEVQAAPTAVVVEEEPAGEEEEPAKEGEGLGEENPEPEAAVAAKKEDEPKQQEQPTQKVDWRDKRIDKLTAQLAEFRQKAANPASPAEGKEAIAAAADAEAEIDRLATEKAQMIAATVAFNERCNAAAKAGQEEFGTSEFTSRINELTKLIDKSDPKSGAAYNQLLEAALETGNAPEILFNLGADLNKAEQLMSMSPVKMAVELTKMAAKAPKEISDAPKPITPVTRRSNSTTQIDPDDKEKADSLSTAAWMARREAQIKDKQARR